MLTPKHTIHCSSLPRIMSCPASVTKPDIEFGGDGNEVSRLGTAVHACLAEYVTGETPDTATVAARENADPDETRLLTYLGRALYDTYAPALKILAVESQMKYADIAPGFDLAGTGDILAEATSAEEPTLVVADWKTGRVDRNYRDQCMGYAAMAVQEWPETVHIKTIIFWVRDRVAEIVDVSREDLAAWRDRLVKVLRHPETYNPTAANCEFCPRQYECPARLALVQQTVSELDATADKLHVLTPQSLAQLYPRVSLLKRTLKTFDDVLRAALESGPVSTGDGRELFLHDRKRKVLDVQKTIDALESRGIDPTPALAVSKSAVSTLVRAAAAPRMKGKDEQAFFEALAEAGAITEAPYTVVTARRISQALEEATHGTEK